MLGYMTPMEWAKQPLLRYALFNGRAPRSEYWWFFLLQLVAMIGAMLVDRVLSTNIGDSGYGWVSLLVGLGLLIPAISVGIRRLHDTDRSGWWLLIGLIPVIGEIVLLVFVTTEGTKGDNQYGPDPWGAGAAA